MTQANHGSGMQLFGAQGELLLFGLTGSLDYAGQIAASLGIAALRPEEREFEDGEHKTRPLVSVRGRDVYVVHSLFGDRRQSGNDKLCRLLFFIGALKDAAAARVTAVVPYLAYARKDRKTKARDPVTTRYVARMFEAVDTDCVLTIDVHNLAAFQNAFRCRTEHLEAAGLFAAHLAPLLGGDEVAVVSPDAGGIKRAEHFRERLARVLGRPVGAGFVEKYRSAGVVSGEQFVGEVEGRTAIVLDDMIATGGTIVRAARACRKHGASRVYAAASHGLFSGDAASTLADPVLDRIFVTDSVLAAALADEPLASRVDVVSSAALVAEAIGRMHTGGSVSELLEA
jgi:ribose-phosphate pyrophosphokinase